MDFEFDQLKQTKTQDIMVEISRYIRKKTKTKNKMGLDWIPEEEDDGVR